MNWEPCRAPDKLPDSIGIVDLHGKGLYQRIYKTVYSVARDQSRLPDFHELLGLLPKQDAHEYRKSGAYSVNRVVDQQACCKQYPDCSVSSNRLYHRAWHSPHDHLLPNCRLEHCLYGGSVNLRNGREQVQLEEHVHGEEHYDKPDDCPDNLSVQLLHPAFAFKGGVLAVATQQPARVQVVLVLGLEPYSPEGRFIPVVWLHKKGRSF